MTVSCYQEDLTEESRQMIERVNSSLAKLSAIRGVSTPSDPNFQIPSSSHLRPNDYSRRLADEVSMALQWGS